MKALNTFEVNFCILFYVFYVNLCIYVAIMQLAIFVSLITNWPLSCHIQFYCYIPMFIKRKHFGGLN